MCGGFDWCLVVNFRGGLDGLVKRIVRVAMSVATVERRAISIIEWQPQLDAFRQVGIGDEVASEGHQIGIASF